MSHKYLRSLQPALSATEAARQQAEQARTDDISRLLDLGLTTEQIAQALGLSVEEVRQRSPQ